jgi:RNA-binding protein
MTQLKGFQRQYLKGLAHNLKPVVSIGQKGITDAVIRTINEALDTHELIKLKMLAFKEKDQKKALIERIEVENKCEVAGTIGHTAILFRQHQDPEKRKITLP